MTIPRDEEAELLQQYTPLLRKLVNHFCIRMDARDDIKEDLIQEASLAFITHIRRMDSLDQAGRCRTPVQRAMFNFLELMSPVHIPHYCYYTECRNISVVPIATDPGSLLVLAETADLEGAVAMRDFVSRLAPQEQQMLALRADGYSNREIVRRLGYSSEWQVARRLKRIQRQYLDCVQ